MRRGSKSPVSVLSTGFSVREHPGNARAAVAAAAVGQYARRGIGGYTGDTLGAVQQKTETVFLVVAALFIPH